MKNIFLPLILIFGFTVFSHGQTGDTKLNLQTEATAKIFLEKTSHDFGTIEEGVQATVTFTFKNTGDAPLVLDTVTATCGCTTPKWTKEPIAPGQEGKVTAIYNSTNRLGNFTKTITIKHNGIGGVQYLSIRGVVSKATQEIEPSVVSP